ncbi:hypothetical protein [Paenibacillus silviterrae]|nr:hypothetical protein [Paenibacillus chinjuensis]
MISVWGPLTGLVGVGYDDAYGFQARLKVEKLGGADELLTALETM